MCRTAGRRCPSYTDPKLIAERNARRRAAYKASHKTKAEPKRLNPTTLFKPFDVYREEIIPETPEYREYIQAGKDFSNSITQQESDAVYGYTDMDYSIIRDYLNGYEMESSTVVPLALQESRQQEIDNTIETIDSALKKADPPASPRTLYRGMMIPMKVKPADMKAWVEENFPVGGVISQKSYMSTSLSTQKALGFAGSYDASPRSVLLEIVSSSGAVLNSQTSSYGEMEREVLLPRGKRFQVVSVTTDAEINYKMYAHKKHHERTTTGIKIIQLVDLDELEGDSAEA